MNWTFWFGRIVAGRLSPQELVDLAVEAWPQIRERIPSEQRVDFLKSALKEHLGTFLEDLNRAERADLMNALLPLAAHEFPLTDLDFLAAFPSADREYPAEFHG
ncbi:MAG: hypothetical protein GYA59_05765 [Chloroflexi bacterium]|nr:hypothetical protein [Chloroflexota bacterium]